MSGPVSFPSGLIFSGPNCQTPFSTANLLGLTIKGGGSLFGGTFSTGIGKPILHSLVPVLIGRSRYLIVFP